MVSFSHGRSRDRSKLAAQRRNSLVLFDSCWDPLPRLGPQHPPTPGVHNSGWVQSPGAAALADTKQHARLKARARRGGSVREGRPGSGGDVWNEPDNDNAGSYPKEELKDKAARVTAGIRTCWISRRCGFTRCCDLTEHPIDRRR
jgi:hypothetical protein